MSEEWTEVEVGGQRFRYGRPGGDWWVETQDAEGQWWVPNQTLFLAGMEAARQEIRELIKSEAEAFEASRDALLRADNPTRAMDCDGRAHTLRTVLLYLSPPDSETES